jgi:hypothetical protein
MHRVGKGEFLRDTSKRERGRRKFLREPEFLFSPSTLVRKKEREKGEGEEGKRRARYLFSLPLYLLVGLFGREKIKQWILSWIDETLQT